jgi:opacity protein-like surface antigen
MTKLIIGYAKQREEQIEDYEAACLGRAMGVMLIVALSLLVSVGASAQRRIDQSFGRPGGYLSLGAGGATESFQLDPFDVDLGSAFTVGGRLGYRASPYVGVEAAVDYSASAFDTRFTTPSGLAEIDTRTLIGTANVKLYPGGWRVQPFLMGGAGALYGMADCRLDGAIVGCTQAGSTGDETVFAGRVGGGVDFYLSRNVALTGEITYVMPTGNLDDLRFVTYGGQLLVRF